MTVTAPRWSQGISGQSVVVDTQHQIHDTWDKSVPSLTSASGVWQCLGGTRCRPSGETAGASLLPHSLLCSPRTGRKVGQLAAGSPQAHLSGDTPQLASPRDVS